MFVVYYRWLERLTLIGDRWDDCNIFQMVGLTVVPSPIPLTSPKVIPLVFPFKAMIQYGSCARRVSVGSWREEVSGGALK